MLFDSHDHLLVSFDAGTVRAFAGVSPPRTIPTQLVSSGYYALQASLFELRPDRLLTSATRWSPLTVRSVLLDTQQISRGKTHVFQHVSAEYTGTAYNG